MSKRTILRVLKGTKLSSEVTQTLGKLLPDYKLEYFEEQPDYKSSIKRRIESLNEAFSFILSAYPSMISLDLLKKYAIECKKSVDLDQENFDSLHKELVKYTAKLIDVLSVAWEWPKGQAVEEAIECLNEAEQYVLMGKGRPDLATLIPMKLGKEGETKFVLQLDESIPPHYPLLIEELKNIKAENYPKTPFWFNQLSEYQQAYLCNLNEKISQPKDIIQDITALISTIEKIKNSSENFITELEKIQTDSSSLPSWFNELPLHHKEMIRVLSSAPNDLENTLTTFKKELGSLVIINEFKNTVTQFLKIPQWYWVLSERQQFFLEHLLKNNVTLEDAISFLSSRHRTLPCPANLAAHSLYTINAKGECIQLGDKRRRSSHIATRDGLEWPQAVQKRHSESNFAKVTEGAKNGQPILMQTLISPLPIVKNIVDYMPKMPKIVSDCMPELPPDLQLNTIARETVMLSSHSKNTFPINHPLNKAKYYYFTEENNKDSEALLEKAEKYISSCPGLEELLELYKSVLGSSIGTATIWDYDGRELFLTSIEQLIILCMKGYSYGSCVSGKDRKAIELLHTDAMLLYKEKYGFWPEFGVSQEKDERLNFVNIVVELYISRHQHEHAGQNAPGSEGIKTPSQYFPADIANAINKRLENDRALEFDDRLATDNEVKNISKKLKSYLLGDKESKQFLCSLVAKSLGEKQCTALYDKLLALVNQKSLFVSSNSMNFFSDTPKGIRGIQKLMENPKAGNNNTERMEAIFEIVLTRPEEDPSRTEATNSVYNRITDLLKPSSCKKGQTLASLVDASVKEWGELFNQSLSEKYMISYYA